MVDERPALADGAGVRPSGPFHSTPSPVDVPAMQRDVEEYLMSRSPKEPVVPESMRPIVEAMVQQTSLRIKHDTLRQLPKAERLPRNRYLARRAFKANLRVIDGGRDTAGPGEAA